jgi:hypothetical protein
MLALPLQGFASASMLYCGPASQGTANAQSAQHNGVQAADHHGNHHSAHGDSSHEHSHSPAAVDDTTSDLHQDAHKCLMCAFCGHSVAVNEFPSAPAFGEPAHVSPPEPWVLIVPMAARVPDKPPRA